MSIIKAILKTSANVFVAFCIFTTIATFFIIFNTDSRLIKYVVGNSFNYDTVFLISIIILLIIAIIVIFIIFMVISGLLKKIEDIASIAPQAPENIDFLSENINTALREKSDFITLYEAVELSEGDLVGFFQINKDRNIVRTNIRVAQLLQLDYNQKTKHSVIAYDTTFNDMIKDLNRTDLEGERDLYYLERNGKMWLNVLLNESKDHTAGVIVDSTKRIKENNNRQIEDRQSKYRILDYDAFIEKIKEELENDPASNYCLASIQLDSLQKINNSYGYRIGDRYIDFAEETIFKASKSYIFGKKSGYVFLILVKSQNSKGEIRTRIAKWFETINSERFQISDNDSIKLKFTAGYAFYPEDTRDTVELLKYSSYALFEAKTLYKGTHHAFSLESYNREAFIEKKINRFYDIIENNSVSYVYQPIVSLKDGSIFGYEALMRPQDDMLNSPKDILDIAGGEKMLYSIERMTAFNCLETVKQNIGLFKNRKLFYNTIADQMLDKEDWHLAMTRYKDYGHILIVEIPERSNEVGFFNKCATLKDNGDKIAIDQFTGRYINYDNIAKLKPDYIKIDKSIIMGINVKKEYQSMTAKLVRFAKENGIVLIAVGVETRMEMNELIKLGIDFAQGYYLSMPEKSFITSINQNVVDEICEIAKYQY